MSRLYTLFLVCVVIASSPFTDAGGAGVCEERQGCRIQQGQCLCGKGCVLDYAYATKEECRTALKGQRIDICERSPCMNSGTCSQTSHVPGYRCRCEGTGFYGTRCQNACPKNGLASNIPLPFECIVI